MRRIRRGQKVATYRKSYVGGVCAQANSIAQKIDHVYFKILARFSFEGCGAERSVRENADINKGKQFYKTVENIECGIRYNMLIHDAMKTLFEVGCFLAPNYINSQRISGHTKDTHNRLKVDLD